MRHSSWDCGPRAEIRGGQTWLHLRGTRASPRWFIWGVPPISVQGLRERPGGQQIGRDPRAQVSGIPLDVIVVVGR